MVRIIAAAPRATPQPRPSEQLTVERDQALRHRVEPEVEHRGACVLAHLDRPALRDRGHRGGERLDVEGVDDMAVDAFAHQFGGAGLPADDDRQAARERFQGSVRERVVEGREHEAVGRAVERPDVRLSAREMHAVADAGLGRSRAQRRFGAILPDDQEPRVPVLEPRERGEQRGHALPRESRSDVQVHHRVVRNAELGAQPRAVFQAQLRHEGVEVHAAVDDVELLLRRAEVALDLVAHHARVADHRAEPRAGEEPPFRRQHVAVVRAEARRKPRERALAARAVLEPLAMDAVARAVHVAAGEPLVRLHEVERLVREPRAHRAREAPVAPQPPGVERIDLQDLAVRIALPFARNHGHLRALPRERLERARNEALGAAERVVALPDDRDTHSRAHSNGRYNRGVPLPEETP